MKTRRNNRRVGLAHRYSQRVAHRRSQRVVGRAHPTNARRPWKAIVLSAFLATLCAPSPVAAAIMFLKGSDEPLHVLTIREDAGSVVVGLPQPNGTFTERVYEKRNIEDFIRTVDARRLAELSPERPSAYRDYAEELAEKKVDPDARAAALRLYVIAAHLDPKNLGRSSLLGMTALARSPLEERRIRALSYLLDPAHDARLLKESTATARPTGDDETGRETLLSMLRSLRKGQGAIARRTAERDEAKAIFLAHGDGLTQKEFIALCRTPPPLPAEQLARVIRLELALSGGASATAGTPDKAEGRSLVSWSTALSTGDVAPIAPLSLETLTEFDPRLSVYRDGKWTAP